MQKRTSIHSQQVVSKLINHLDRMVWNKKAEKVIDKILPFGISKLSQKIFDDSVMLICGSKQQARIIKDQFDVSTELKDNYLSGYTATKFTNSRFHTTISDLNFQQNKSATKQVRKQNRLSTTQRIKTNMKKKVEKRAETSSLILLPQCQKMQNVQQKEDRIRTIKLSADKYLAQQKQIIDQKNKLLQINFNKELKKLKESQNIVYDYDSKLVGGKSKSVNCKPITSLKYKCNESTLKTFSKSQRGQTVILNKRIVNFEEQQLKKTFQVKAQKRQILTDQQSIKQVIPQRSNIKSLFQFFINDKILESGVNLTDVATKSKLLGQKFNKNKANMKLNQYKKLCKVINSDNFEYRSKRLSQLHKKSMLISQEKQGGIDNLQKEQIRIEKLKGKWRSPMSFVQKNKRQFDKSRIIFSNDKLIAENLLTEIENKQNNFISI